MISSLAVEYLIKIPEQRLESKLGLRQNKLTLVIASERSERGNLHRRIPRGRLLRYARNDQIFVIASECSERGNLHRRIPRGRLLRAFR